VDALAPAHDADPGDHRGRRPQAGAIAARRPQPAAARRPGPPPQRPPARRGALLDLGVYPVSFASQLFGPPQRVQAVATLTPSGVDAHVAAMLSYPGGAITTFWAASTMRGPNTATVTGTRGRIEVDAVWYGPASFRVYDSSNELIESYRRPELNGQGMQFQASEMDDLVRRG
jgi:predicted dehydrogenase